MQKRLSTILFLLALIVGAALRFYRFADKPFWVDELQELIQARSNRPLFMLETSGTDLVGYTWHHLVYLMGVEDLHFWHRLLAVLCGVAVIPVTYLLGSRLYSRWVGAGSAGVVALTFVQVYHSQDARAVSYETLGAALAAFSAIRVFLDRFYRWLPGVWAGCVVLSWSHFFGLLHFFFLSAVLLGVIWRREALGLEKGRKPILQFLLAWIPSVAAAAAALFPVLWFIAVTKGSDVPASPLELSLGQKLSVIPLAFTYFSGISGTAALLPGIVALLGGVFLSWKERHSAATFLLPAASMFVIPLAANLTGHLPHFDLYHLVYLTPVYAVCLTAGAEGLARILLVRLKAIERYSASLSAVAVLLLAAAGNGSELARYYQRNIRLSLGPNYPEVAKFIETKRVGDGDMLAFNYSIEFIGMNFYLGRLFSNHWNLALFRPEKESAKTRFLFHSATAFNLPDTPLITSERVRTIAEFRAMKKPYHGTVWIVLPWDELMESLPGIGVYSGWFYSHDVVLPAHMASQERIPPGFQLERFQGVDLVWKHYDGVSSDRVATEVEPILLENASSHACGDIPQLGGASDRCRPFF